MRTQTIEHVAAGQYRSGRKQINTYQRYLGTCLGVALYDPETQVGGMIHILLPEPPSVSNLDCPEKYASTGLSLLINELVKLGAKTQNLEASIAGGALVGPISQMDMNLDIGGRSADIAATILGSYGIKVIKSETGGFFMCTLELNMETGQTHIHPAWEYTARSQMEFKAPSLENIFQTIEQLKPIPQTALKIFRMFQSSQYHITDITDELAKDQVLSAQALKLCNSALFSGMIKIDTLKDAVLLMGEHMLVKTVITAAVDNYYDQTGTGGYSLCKGGLFFHAVGVAILAEKIAQKLQSPFLKIAYTAGLLHDIGKVVLDQYVSESTPLLFRRLGEKNESFLEAEKKLMGITHCEAGGILAKKWQFSDILSTVIRLHHTPEKSEKQQDLVYIVHLADYIMEKFSTGLDLEKIHPDNFNTALDHCGLTAEDIPELVDAIPLNAFGNDGGLHKKRFKK
ncbi:MAG: HDOD domain-containing protein [Proteobacteria bacterium]|nr:HDOD domain-containing protein [Pseudomonadota bacterium]MBU1387434.1 HDOD domain-containing protein [Pseudomonadota bacterium]MBU1541719.1 HDOD domain-containing protein [Pseudomonadota bacterium]MBU2479663.1 HDOD domain-containing protein [Pseudomonadota bacterium]